MTTSAWRNCWAVTSTSRHWPGERRVERRVARLSGGVDLVILDAMLPGWTVSRVARSARSDIPVMLTARRGWTGQGLELGADDYLPKSVRGELVARIQHSEARRAARDVWQFGRCIDTQLQLRCSAVKRWS
jgi:DNA-binding response OmpR family regulator